MRLSHLKLICSVLLLTTLALTTVLVPRFIPLAHAQTSVASLQCGTGGVVTVAPGTSPVGTTASSPATIVAASPLAGLTCTPASAAVAAEFNATATVTTCAVVTAYTAPTSTTAGSMMINGLPITIPLVTAVPGFLGLGATAIVSFLIPGGQLVSVSRGYCRPPGTTILTTVLSGAGAAVNGKGTATVILFPNQGTVCYQINVSGILLPATAAHIHQGAAGTAGPIVIPFTAPDVNGYAAGCVSADPALIRSIIANPGDFYVNVHTTDFPAGAVRGQLG